MLRQGDKVFYTDRNSALFKINDIVFVRHIDKDYSAIKFTYQGQVYNEYVIDTAYLKLKSPQFKLKRKAV